MMKYYHGSIDQLHTGLILLPNKDGYVHSYEEIVELENLFEKYKPKDKLSRLQAVYLVDNIDDVDSCGGYNDYVYQVELYSIPEKSDLNWYSVVSSLVGDYDIKDLITKKVIELIANYWNGIASNNPCWEYRVNKAMIYQEV